MFKISVTDHFLTVTSFDFIEKNEFTTSKDKEHLALPIIRFGTTFQEQFSFDKLVTSISILDELGDNFNTEVRRIHNTFCFLRTKQYCIHRFLNPLLTDETFIFVKFKCPSVSPVRGNFIANYILTDFKYVLGKILMQRKNHITPVD